MRAIAAITISSCERLLYSELRATCSFAAAAASAYTAAYYCASRRRRRAVAIELAWRGAHAAMSAGRAILQGARRCARRHVYDGRDEVEAMTYGRIAHFSSSRMNAPALADVLLDERNHYISFIEQPLALSWQVPCKCVM